ncbi:MAG: hypothetical protein NZ524_00055, partial [Thiobacillaceae bacterium]|nr:hypothetical protein [Thiobacillaceae bacterium]
MAGFLRRAVWAREQGRERPPATTTPARVCIGAARFAPALRAILADQPELRAALTFVKPGVRLDANGLAEQDMLRFEEVVLAGARLQAQVELDDDLPPPVCAAALALIAAGARICDRLGGKRRRGHGRCRMGFEADMRPLQDLPPAIPAAATRASLALSTGSSPSGRWRVLRLVFELQGPVCIPAATMGNVVQSRDHLPAALLLPALDARLRAGLAAEGARLTAHLAAGR